jgi:hypothetical protein
VNEIGDKDIVLITLTEDMTQDMQDALSLSIKSHWLPNSKFDSSKIKVVFAKPLLEIPDVQNLS